MTMQMNGAKLMAVTVIDDTGNRQLHGLSPGDVLTLLACVAEDPGDWGDFRWLWPRCRVEEDEVELFDALNVSTLSQEEATLRLDQIVFWLSIDLVRRRLLLGGANKLADAEALWSDDDWCDLRDPVLPPWWEFECGAQPADIFSQRREPLIVPHVRRDVLWGSPMIRFFAQRLIEVASSDTGYMEADRLGNMRAKNKLLIRLHRDWLMTPQPDLQGGIPREQLHLGIVWVESRVATQHNRVYRNERPRPIPTQLSSYANAPLGPHEVIVYYHACREVLEAGCRWLAKHARRTMPEDAEQRLALAMEHRMAHWMKIPFEDGPSPSDIVQSERARIPLVEQSSEHADSCDCPICELLATGLLGQSILHYGGYELELEGEYAFSIHSRREDWEEEQALWIA